MYSVFPELFAYMLQGFDADPELDEMGRIKSFETHFPSGAGYRNFLHYAQLLNSETFKRYDFGSRLENIKRYGVPEPEDYPLQNIPTNIPIALLAGSGDVLTAPEDIKWLAEQLGERVVMHKTY